MVDAQKGNFGCIRMKMLQALSPGQWPTSPEMPNNLDSHVLRMRVVSPVLFIENSGKHRTFAIHFWGPHGSILMAVNIRGRDYIQWSQPLTTQNLKEFTCLKHEKKWDSPVIYEINLNKPGFFYRQRCCFDPHGTGLVTLAGLGGPGGLC
jgi:hypothetical protein